MYRNFSHNRSEECDRRTTKISKKRIVAYTPLKLSELDYFTSYNDYSVKCMYTEVLQSYQLVEYKQYILL